MRCIALTRDGERCQVNADPDSDFCHVHRPDGKWRQQHPGYELPGTAPVSIAELRRAKNEAFARLAGISRRIQVYRQAHYSADGYADLPKGWGAEQRQARRDYRRARDRYHEARLQPAPSKQWEAAMIPASEPE